MVRQKINRKKLIKLSALSAAGILIVVLLSFGIFSITYASKSYPRQYIGEMDLGALKRTEIKNRIKNRTDKFLKEKLILINTNTGRAYEITPAEIGLTYDVDKTVDDVWQSGRNSNVFKAIGEQLRSLFTKTAHNTEYSLNDEVINQKIKTIAKELDKPEKDFKLVYSNHKFTLSTNLKVGSRIDQANVKNDIRNKIARLEIGDYNFALQKCEPEINKEKARTSLEKANKIIAGGSMILLYENQQFEIDTDTVAGFIFFEKDGDDLKISFNENRAKKYVATIGKSINVKPQNAKLTISNGKVTVFQNSEDGKTLDEAQTLADIKNAIFARIEDGETAVDSKNIALKVAILGAEITNNQIDTLGINELVGSAYTDFVGSPSNRIHNITVGANAINGVLLKPGEEFSTLGHLGTIDAAGGYLEELVIKEDRTAPEFGGGLCQVSSTLFRAALNSGMKITERLNHKYRVSYYEPPVGMDATIYDPAPDFKFINNYKSYVLIQSKIVGTKLTFDFYGTKDDRRIEISTPKVFDYTNPGKPIMIETDTLPAGEKKQIEHAHQGATAKFDYKVTSSDGKVLQEKTFISKYVPWPEKWLVEKKPDSKKAKEDKAKTSD